MNFNIRQKKVIEATESKILCLAGAGSGKALPNSTKIPTPDGWKRVDEIRVGDYLFDREGKPTKVLGVYPQGELDVYEMTFGDGRKARCSKDHIWRVYTNRKKEYKNSFKDLTVEEMLKKGLLKVDKRGHTSANFLIPCSKAIQMQEIKYDIHPYVIGAFLGDGCCKEGALTMSSNDIEIIQKIDSLIGGHGFKKLCQNNYSWSFYCEPYISQHNHQPVLFYQTKQFFAPYIENICCAAYEKSIPEIYKRGSIEQRLQLLQGLFDTDGSITKTHGYMVRFTSTSKRLIQDVKEVLGSLGYVSTIHEDKRENKYTKNIAYNLNVNIPNSEKFKLFSLDRKKKIAMEAINKKQHRNYDRTTIRAIESLNYKEEMTCFYVDNEEHLFLTENHLVTHNTTVLTERIKNLIKKGCKPEDIIAISFTNMAADEMKERLGDISKGAFIGTIHSLANFICVSNGIDTEKYIADANFDMILKKALTLPKKRFPEVKHVLVDEFQDICEDDWNFLEKIRTENFFVVSDERQEIFGFRGGSSKYLHDLYDDPTCKVYNLTENYRCAPNILEFADSLIASMKKISLKAVAVKQENGYINDDCSFMDALEQLEWSEDWGNWFILCRTNNELVTAMEILEKREIPYVSFKKGDLDLIEMNNLLKENKVKLLTVHSCMSGDTLIPTSNGIMTIKEIVEQSDSNILVYNGKYYDRVKEFINNGKELTYKITSKCGSSIRLTENHDVIILDKSGLKKVKVKELKGKENILLRKNISNYMSKQIEMQPVNDNEIYHNVIHYPVPAFLTPELAELIGMITADGTHNKLSIHYLKRHKECVERFAELIKICFNKDIVVKQCTDKNAWFTECNSRFILTYLYKNFDGIENNNKFISSQILQSDQVIQCAFLKGLFEDGTVGLKKGKVDNITLVFKNPIMQTQLQTLLFTLGIDASFTTHTYKKFPLNYCYIYSSGIHMFKEKIGFISKFKQDRLNIFEQKYHRKNKSSIFKEIMLMHKDELYIKGQSMFWSNLTKNQGLTEGIFFKYYNLLNEEQKQKDYIILIKNIFENYQIEEIISVEPYKKEETYCLTMEHESQFIQNGFLMGNSKGLQSKHVIVTGARMYSEEERRISYVAATRAQQSLYWTPSIYKSRKRSPNRDKADAGRVFEKASKGMVSFE